MELNVIKYAWLSSQQLVIYEANAQQNSSPKGWGSGFLFGYKDRVYLITCDHVPHGEDHDCAIDGRLGKTDDIYIYMNHNIGLNTELYKVGSPLYFDELKFHENGEKLEPEYTDFPDIAIYDLPGKLIRDILTRELKGIDNSTVIVKAGETKLLISEKTMKQYSEDSTYLMTGCIKNKIDGVKNPYCNAIYGTLKFDHVDNDGTIILKTDFSIDDESSFAGLSGSPVFDESDGGLLGMFFRVSVQADSLSVIPIKTITKFIDMYNSASNLSTESHL